MMRKLMGVIVGVALLVVAGGCVESTLLVTVDKDGSGTIVQKYTMSAQTVAMIEGMKASFGGMAGEGVEVEVDKEDPIYDEAKFKAAAAQLGEGVTFVSGKRIEKEDGSKGGEVRYAFKDVTKLNVKPFIGDDDEGGGGMKMSAGDDPITFEFEKGAKSKLTINLPQKDDAADADDGMDPEMKAQQQAAGMAMMKGFMQGMRIRMFVKVNGEIEESNATYVSRSGLSKKKQIIGLMDMNIGAVINDPVKFKKVIPALDLSPKKAMEALKDVPEIKMETQEKVTVIFK